MPIIGDTSLPKLIENIYKYIVDEANAADFYSRLLKEAPDELHRQFVKHAYEDEIGHVEAFSKLYVYLTNQKPQYQITPVKYETYKAEF